MNDDFRQSPEFQKLLHQNAVQAIDMGGEEVGYLMRVKILPFINFLIVPRVQNHEAVALANKWSRHYRSIFVNLLPKVPVDTGEAALWETELKAHGFSAATLGAAPTKTSIVDIGSPEADLLARMKEKTRYNVRLSQRRGVTARMLLGSQILEDRRSFDEFFTIYHANCRRVGMKNESRSALESLFGAFRENSFVVYACLAGGEIAAVGAYVVAGDTIYYQMNGSTEKGRQEFAPYTVVWEGMLEGKRRGCRWFDFDGIFDERFAKAQKKWKGFSRFKTGFGGVEVTYLGSFSKWFPFLKRS